MNIKKDCDTIIQQKLIRSQKQESKQTNNMSVITDHAGRENHVIDWDVTRLVARESQDSARRIRVAIWIKRTPNNVNRDVRGGGGGGGGIPAAV